MPSPLINSTLGVLIKKLLKLLDSYNSTDLTLSTTSTDSNSSGEVAKLAINMALQKIYSMLKDSKYLQAYPTTSLVSVANQDWIDLDPETELDEIETICDTSNMINLKRVTWSWYRRNYPDPSRFTGTPLIYARRGQRIYLAPRPVSAITYTTDFVKLTNDLQLNGDVCLLPQALDFWTISEARVQWAMMEDPNHVPAAFITERDKAEQAGLNMAMSGFDLAEESGSHWNENQTFYRDYQRPVGGA